MSKFQSMSHDASFYVSPSLWSTGYMYKSVVFPPPGVRLRPSCVVIRVCRHRVNFDYGVKIVILALLIASFGKMGARRRTALGLGKPTYNGVECET